MKGKFVVLCLLVACLLFSLSGCKTEEERAAAQAKENWEQTSDETRMGIYCALIKEYMLLTEDLGGNTPYPAMKRSVKGNMMSGGLTEAEAIESAKAVIIQEQAIFWYGANHGIDAGEDNVADYIEENVLQEIQASETYAAVDAMCAKEGITYEDTVWAYENSYKMQYILIQSGVSSEDEIEFVNQIVADYGKTEAYKELVQVLETCAALIADDVTDKEALRNAEIYIEG